jgi:hypothetical protein
MVQSSRFLLVVLLTWCFGFLHTQHANAQIVASCLGCNVVENGEFDEYLIGTTVHGDSWGDLYVIDVRWSDYHIYAENDYGEQYWYDAYDVYSRAEMDERNGAKVTGAVVGAAILYCIFGGCSSDESSNSNSGSGYGGQSRASCEAACYKQGDPDPIQESANRNACLRQCN